MSILLLLLAVDISKIPYGTSSFIKHLVVYERCSLMVDTRNKRESFIQFLCQHQHKKKLEVKVGMGNVRNKKEEKNKQGTFGKEKSIQKPVFFPSRRHHHHKW